MADSHRIVRIIEINEFIQIIKYYNENQIIITKHTTFRLNQEQRKIFKDEMLKDLIMNQVPMLVGLQTNNSYAAFYRCEQEILKLILDIKIDKINAVTFYITNKLPRL